MTVHLNGRVSVGWAEPETPSSTMPAVVFRQFGPPEVLHVEEVSTPEPAPDEVLVQVRAVAVGRYLDVSARAGLHPFPGYRFPHILGAEHAGVIAAVGSAVEESRIGQRVAGFPNISCGRCPRCLTGEDDLCSQLQLLGMHRPGAYAAYVAVPARNVREVPSHIEPEPATALALAGAVILNQLAVCRFVPGQWVLVQGAAGALGLLSCSMIHHLGGRVIAMSRTAEKREQLAGLGFDAVLDPTATDVASTVLDLTSGAGADIVIDNLGDPASWATSVAVLASGGRLVSSGAFLGHDLPLDLRSLYIRGQHIIGVRTGNRASVEALWELVEAGYQPPSLCEAFEFTEAAEAHRLLEDNRNVGRVTLVAPSGWS